MYQIPIDDINYHVNSFSEGEIAWVEGVLVDTLKQYPELRGFIKKTTAPLCLTADGIKNYLCRVLLAFCYTVKRDFPVETRGQLCKTVKKWLNLFLPTIVGNDRVFRASHPVQYEPRVLASIALSAFLGSDEVSEKIAAEGTGTFEKYLIWECINFARAIKSSTLLFAVGDDVHGLCNFRGASEILSKLLLAGRFPDEYVLFKDFNAHLQYKKMYGEALPEEMTAYLDQCPESAGNLENFLAYGWARDAKGKRILTMTSLIKTAFPDNENLLLWARLSSEFVHEDYVAVDYDYPMFRREILKLYFESYYSVLDTVGSFFTQAERKKNGFSAIRHLFTAVADTYRTNEK